MSSEATVVADRPIDIGVEINSQHIGLGEPAMVILGRLTDVMAAVIP